MNGGIIIMLDYAPHDPFVSGIIRAWAKLAQGEGVPRVVDWGEEKEPIEIPDEIDYSTPLPRGVTWNKQIGKIYAYCYVCKGHKLTFGNLAPTPENVARAARQATAARAMRAAGGDAATIKRAGLETT
jgi:hypothetical protein